MKKIILVILLFGNVFASSFAQEQPQAQPQKQSVKTIDIAKLNHYWIWVDKDLTVDNAYKFKQADVLFVKNQCIRFGNDSISINKLGDNFTLIDTSYKDKTNLTFVENNIDSSIWINNRMDSLNILMGCNRGVIKMGYSKLINDSLLLFYYTDSVTKWKSKNPLTPSKGKANVCVFFNIGDLQYDFSINKGVDSLVINTDTAYLYHENELKYCYTDTLLGQFISDTLSLYYQDDNNVFWIFDETKIPIPPPKPDSLLPTIITLSLFILLIILLVSIKTKKPENETEKTKEPAKEPTIDDIDKMIKLFESLLNKK